jgi:rhamnulokinase
VNAAIDLGAGSGRVFVGEVSSSAVTLDEAHRFQYPPRRIDGHLRWDMAALVEGLRTGLRSAVARARATGGELVSAGVDAWGVDYGLIDRDGHLVEEPVCYRDERTADIMEDVFARVPREAIFDSTGIQFLQLNTLFQLAAHAREGLPARASRLLLMPDLCHHLFCGSLTCERTNASTTQLLNAGTGEWDAELLSRTGVPRALMPDLVDAGTDLGQVRPDLRRELDLPPLRIVAPATHDTASAFVGTPLQPGWACISSGTWSLVGVERDAPIVNPAAREANFTNERGAGGTIRFLKNVMGLWILESCRREWRAAGKHDDLPGLLAAVANVPQAPARTRAAKRRATIDPDHPRFFNPPSMLAELRMSLAEYGHIPADEPVSLTKIILDSLAARYASIVSTIETLTGSRIPGIHIVGGGSQNDYLNQATADATGRPVLAGPVEATALGNLLMQSLACGRITSIAEGRHAIAASVPLRRFDPWGS